MANRIILTYYILILPYKNDAKNDAKSDNNTDVRTYYVFRGFSKLDASSKTHSLKRAIYNFLDHLGFPNFQIASF